MARNGSYSRPGAAGSLASVSGSVGQPLPDPGPAVRAGAARCGPRAPAGPPSTRPCRSSGRRPPSAAASSRTGRRQLDPAPAPAAAGAAASAASATRSTSVKSAVDAPAQADRARSRRLARSAPPSRSAAPSAGALRSRCPARWCQPWLGEAVQRPVARPGRTPRPVRRPTRRTRRSRSPPAGSRPPRVVAAPGRAAAPRPGPGRRRARPPRRPHQRRRPVAASVTVALELTDAGRRCRRRPPTIAITDQAATCCARWWSSCCSPTAAWPRWSRVTITHATPSGRLAAASARSTSSCGAITGRAHCAGLLHWVFRTLTPRNSADGQPWLTAAT